MFTYLSSLNTICWEHLYHLLPQPNAQMLLVKYSIVVAVPLMLHTDTNIVRMSTNFLHFKGHAEKLSAHVQYTCAPEILIPPNTYLTKESLYPIKN